MLLFELGEFGGRLLREKLGKQAVFLELGQLGGVGGLLRLKAEAADALWAASGGKVGVAGVLPELADLYEIGGVAVKSQFFAVRAARGG